MKYSVSRIILRFILLLKIYSSARTIEETDSKKTSLNIAVIGAGPSGLASAKHSIEQGHNVTVFEQIEEVGGLWVYTDEVGKNRYGIDIHTALYNDLRANGPIQLMEYPNFFYPNGTIPFPPRIDILKYLQSYAEHFDLKKHIKFGHLVVRVLPIENGRWEIIVKDLPNDRFITQIFDAVFICNGHFSSPKYPDIVGANQFKGKILHSHDFRATEEFRGENVLIIGGGVSGVDLTFHLLEVADRVTLSRKKKLNQTQEEYDNYRKLLPPKIIHKGIVKRITADGAEFADGTHESYSVIIFATGYKYSYPFLSVDTGIHIDDNFVQPLYMHVFNIEHPTMAFIGILQSLLNYYMFDIQSRFALKFLSGEKKLPPKDDMLEEQRLAAESKLKQGQPKRKIHSIIFTQKEYFKKLSNLADIENVPEFLDDLALDAVQDLIDKPSDFRKYRFTVFENNTYIKERIED